MTNGPDSNGWTQGSVDQLLDLALLQGNRFIKGLLREKQLRIGTNKEQFERNLREAIANEQVTPSDIQGWLNDVEGWGNQHAFVFGVPAAEAEAARDRGALSERLRDAGLADLLDAEIPLDPSDELTLATVRHGAEGISFLWVRGSPSLLRRLELDREDEIDGNEIEFHAYERRWSRVAARFEFRFDARTAAVFLTQHEDRDYAQQRDRVLERVDSVIPERESWSALDISRVITRLDAAGLHEEREHGAPVVRMSSTVFQGASASIRLAANTQASGYQDDAGVRAVRLSVNPAQFIGGAGDCYLTPTAGADEESRELHLRLFGREQRILLWGKMTADEVWRVVTDLRAYAVA
jgi:hypothetical protein